jgi:hypothetical protein
LSQDVCVYLLQFRPTPLHFPRQNGGDEEHNCQHNVHHVYDRLFSAHLLDVTGNGIRQWTGPVSSQPVAIANDVLPILKRRWQWRCVNMGLRYVLLAWSPACAKRRWTVLRLMRRRPGILVAVLDGFSVRLRKWRNLINLSCLFLLILVYQIYGDQQLNLWFYTCSTISKWCFSQL